MNPIELFVSSLAPHVCMSCKKEGAVLCLSCMLTDITLPQPACYKCQQATLGYICVSCSQETGINNVYIGATYAGFAKDLAAQLKFHRAKMAATSMSLWLNQVIGPLPTNTVVCPIPTAPKRVRARGYDQASLIAKHFAKQRRLPYMQLFDRITATRQVGATRKERFEQLHGAYVVRNQHKIQNRHILLIDDVMTTGSTIESAAISLQAAGINNISALVFAYQASKAKVKTFPSSTRTDT